MYYIVWNYTVEKAKQPEFEKEYSRGGTWFKFFEPCDDYLGHELIRSEDGQTYMLIDKWMSKDDYEGFLKGHQLEYDALNAKFAGLYQSEIKVGTFEAV
jgi:heme-degrading monooxygenase HmoA